MRKGIAAAAAMLLFVSALNGAEYFETVYEIPFSEIAFYTKYDPYEGMMAGMAFLKIWEDTAFFSDTSKMVLNIIEKNGNIKKIKNGIYGTFTRVAGSRLLMGATYPNGIIRIFNSRDITTPEYVITVPELLNGKKQLKVGQGPYITGKYLIAETVEKSLVMWELQNDGNAVFYDEDETAEKLAGDIGIQIGYKKKSSIFFGDTTLDGYALYFDYIWQKLLFPKGKYQSLENLQDFLYIGGDKKGLSYFYALDYPSRTWLETYSQEPLTVVIAIVNTWTREVELREMAAGEWNPPRDDERGILISYSQTVDEDGNIYFTDADTEKQVYQIKKLKNTWWESMGLNKQDIGRINTNRTALYTAKQKSSEVVGYCYENDFVKIVKKEKEWSLAEKLDGSKGWIENTYMTIE